MQKALPFASRSFAASVALSAALGLCGPAHAQNFLDDMIYSVKCAGAEDKEACKAKARQDVEDYQARKQGAAAPTAQTASAAQSSSNEDRCEKLTTSGPADVDAAYIRAMKTFHFTTQEQMDLKAKNSAIFIVNQRYKHVRTPGVMYDMWDFVDVPGYQGVRPVAGLLLSKSTKGGTDLEVEYCVGGANPIAGNSAFWAAADKAFRSLVK